MTSPSTTILKPVMQMPHRIINKFSRGSSARHLRWRCSFKTRPSKRIVEFPRFQRECAGREARELPPGMNGLLDVANESKDLHGIGAQIRRELVLDRLADL